MVNSVYPLKSELHGYTPSETHTGGFYVKNNIALIVTVIIASVEAIGELQRLSVMCCSV